MFNNLLYFFTAIALFSMARSAETPWLPTWASLSFLVLTLICYQRLVHFIQGRAEIHSSAAYFQVERKGSLLAVFFFALATYVCDLKYYLSVLPGDEALPSLVNVAGLLLFFIYLAIMWRAVRPAYQRIFGRSYTTAAFIALNVRVNLPIVLPWVLLSLLYDLFALCPWSGLQDLLLSGWGDLLFYLLFLFFVLLFAPPLMRRLWGCTRMPEGALRDRLTAFCARQGFYAEIYLWPLLEGRALTAGVVGVVPGLRYLLITPSLIEALTLKELESVMAHEIGHVRKRHLLLYLILIAGFTLVLDLWSAPLTFFLLSRDFFYGLMRWSGLSAETMLLVCGTLPLLLLMLVYFRYLFGYFIRNFERQADLHVFSAIGSSHALVSAFEKIALLSGNSRNQPSWHHFGIGERVAYLQRCEEDPQERGRHLRKVWSSVGAYLLVLAALMLLARQMPVAGLERQYEEKYVEAFLWQKLQQEPDNALWLRLSGDLMQYKKMEKKALDAYERAMAFAPVSPDLLNNLAWLLLTSADPQLRDPGRALILSRAAVVARPQGSFLDTLGLAYWANGLIVEAVVAEEQALLADPAGREYYQQQIERFRTMSYQQDLRQEQEDEPRQRE